MTVIYRLRTDEIYDEEGILHTVYGIDVLNNQNCIIDSIADIFLDGVKAKKFVDLCNELNLSLIHLPEVIEDALE